MPLLTVPQTGAAKLGPISATYRAAHQTMFGTCPRTCSLNPCPDTSATAVDRDYFDTLLSAVPRAGLAWTYTHFPIRQWVQRWRSHRASGKPTTVVNWSTEDPNRAARAARSGIPTVLAAPASTVIKVRKHRGVRFVQCPATSRETGAVTCASCGGGVPLCARDDRDYVIVFPAHGATAKRVGTDADGGCYAAGGNVALHWRRLAEQASETSDADALKAFVRSLLPRTMLRHHIAGDIGLASSERDPARRSSGFIPVEVTA